MEFVPSREDLRLFLWFSSKVVFLIVKVSPSLLKKKTLSMTMVVHHRITKELSSGQKGSEGLCKGD